jgi:hypothetical protein
LAAKRAVDLMAEAPLNIVFCLFLKVEEKKIENLKTKLSVTEFTRAK